MKYEMKDTYEMTLGSIKSLILPGVGIAVSFSPFCFDCHGGLQSLEGVHLNPLSLGHLVQAWPGTTKRRHNTGHEQFWIQTS